MCCVYHYVSNICVITYILNPQMRHITDRATECACPSHLTFLQRTYTYIPEPHLRNITCYLGVKARRYQRHLQTESCYGSSSRMCMSIIFDIPSTHVYMYSLTTSAPHYLLFRRESSALSALSTSESRLQVSHVTDPPTDCACFPTIHSLTHSRNIFYSIPRRESSASSTNESRHGSKSRLCTSILYALLQHTHSPHILYLGVKAHQCQQASHVTDRAADVSSNRPPVRGSQPMRDLASMAIRVHANHRAPHHPGSSLPILTVTTTREGIFFFDFPFFFSNSFLPYSSFPPFFEDSE